MTKQTRVAWVTFDAPNRHGGGGNIRQAYLFEALAKRCSVDLFVSDSGVDAVTNALARRVLAVPGERQRSPRRRLGNRFVDLWTAVAGGPPEAWNARPAISTIVAVMKRNGPYDVAIVEHPGLVPLAARRGLARTWVVTMHNVGSERARQQATAETGRRQAWLSRRETVLARRLEQRAAQLFDAVIAVSPKDALLLPGHPVVIPNGVDLSRLHPTALPSAPHVVLTGTLGYLPNVDGAHWFVDQVWPLVRRAEPRSTLALVGKAPFPSVLALHGHQGVTVHADVPEIAPFLGEARVAVVPLRIGSGTRLKALDAMAAGRPVVGTTIGLEGLNVVERVTALVADEPAQFASAVVTLMRDDELAQRLAVAGRAFVTAEHDWTRIGEQFADFVLELPK